MRVHAATLEHMLLLRSLPAFSRLDEEALAAVARRTEERVVPAGTVLLREGQPFHRTHLVVDGGVRVEAGGAVVKRSEKRMSVGILGMLAGLRSQRTVVTDRRSRLLTLDRDPLLDVMEEDFAVLDHVLRVISSRIIETWSRLGRDFQAPERLRPVPAHLQVDRPLDLVERVLAVRQVPAFGRSSLDSVARYARMLEQARLPAGATLWTEGEPCQTYVHLVRGSVSGSRTGAAGGLRYGPPAMPGLFGVLSGGESCWYTARATSDVLVLRADREVLLDLLEDDFEMAAFCLKLSARRLVRFLALGDEPVRTGAGGPVPPGAVG
jgi:CRP-like cAMP-binding protein